MQKVVGSNPISRFRRVLYLQAFFVSTVGLCVCVAPDRNRTRGKPATHSTPRKRPFAGNSGSFEPLTFCQGTQKVMSSIFGRGSIRNPGVSARRPYRRPRQPSGARTGASQRSAQQLLLVAHRRS